MGLGVAVGAGVGIGVAVGIGVGVAVGRGDGTRVPTMSPSTLSLDPPFSAGCGPGFEEGLHPTNSNITKQNKKIKGMPCLIRFFVILFEYIQTFQKKHQSFPFFIFISISPSRARASIASWPPL